MSKSNTSACNWQLQKNLKSLNITEIAYNMHGMKFVDGYITETVNFAKKKTHLFIISEMKIFL